MSAEFEVPESAIVVAAGRIGIRMEVERIDVVYRDARGCILPEQSLLKRLANGLLA